MKLRKEGEAGDFAGFIDEGAELNGELRFKSIFRVDGQVKGKIFSESELHIGEKGVVEAEIEIGSIFINGIFRGKILAKNRVHIHASGKVFGEIETPILVIEEGAVFQGNCKMQEKTI